MANFNKQNTAWPQTTHDKLVENDPSIVKVPMDNVDFGARKGTMNKAKSPDSGGNSKLNIRHVGGEK